jgi:hypothetical protein
MTQPEMLAPCPCGRAATFLPDDSYGSCHAGCNCEAEPYIIRPIGHDAECIAAWNAFAARPTAGIDRATLARAMNPALFDAAPEVAHQAASPIIVEVAQRRAMTVAGEVLERLALPTAAKTGERGAVIEECLAAVRAVVRQQDADHGAANSGGAEAALEAIRALSQPLPDAPIVGGEEGK